MVDFLLKVKMCFTSINNNNNKESSYMAQNQEELRAPNMKTRETISKTRTVMRLEKLDGKGGS